MSVGDVSSGMRVVLAVAVLTSCSKEQQREHEPPPAVQESRTNRAPQQIDDLHDEPCPHAAGVAPIKPTIVAEGIVMLHETMPLRWVSKDEQVHELADDVSKPRDLGAFTAPAWDDLYWYRRKCYEDCDDRTSFGVPQAVERINRHTGESKQLGRSVYGLGDIALVGDYVYYGTYPHGMGGALYRIRREGGIVETVLDRENISDLMPSSAGLLVFTANAVFWIANDEKPRLLYRAKDDVRAAIVDGDQAFVADYGEAYWKSDPSGSIHRISLATNEDTKLAGPLKWPSAITAFGDSVYFMLGESDEVWEMSKTGTKARVIVPHDPAAKPCEESLRLWADKRGLFWLRGRRFLTVDRSDTLFFVPWSALGR